MDAWLRLSLEPGVGPITAQRLITKFQTVDRIFSSSVHELRPVVGQKLASQLAQAPAAEIEHIIANTLRWGNAPNRYILTLHDDRYPSYLKTMCDPPPVLYAQGNLNALSAPMLAIVGARNASEQGQKNAYAFAYHLSHQGWSIVSGLAHGIDASAHQGALAAHGQTIAVMGTGLDIIYPRQHHALASAIQDQGLLLSEFPLGMPSKAHHFPRRNRIVAGLSLGILIVEAALKSGSLITANYALEMGRDVFAIPGSIHSPLSKGCHQLIKEGAMLVEDINDILFSFRQTPTPMIHPQATEIAHPLFKFLGFDPITLDDLLQLSKIDINTLHTWLFELELKGFLVRLPGGMLQRQVKIAIP